MTVKEIAELAGTSRGTVDRVLHGRGNVRPELRSKILKVIEETHYKPNQLARALINSRKKFHIGVVLHSVGNPFFEDVLKGIRYRAAKFESHGIELTVKEIKGFSAREQIEAIDELKKEQIDGLVIMPIDVAEIRRVLSSLAIPVVTLNTDIEVPKVAFVGCDYVNSGMICGDLAKLILCNGGTVAIVIGNATIAGHTERVKGFLASVGEAEAIRVMTPIENEDDDDISYRKVKALLQETAPDLIYFGAAGIEGGIRAVLECGRRIHIVTVDYTDTVKRYLKSGVIAATVTQQPFVQGDEAINILFNVLADDRQPRDTNNYTRNQVLLRNSKEY